MESVFTATNLLNAFYYLFFTDNLFTKKSIKMDKEFDFIYWDDLKYKLRQEYPQLTNADLLWRNGTEEDLLRMIAFKLGKTKRELQAVIENF